MPRFCQLGANCVGTRTIPGPPYKVDQRFCSKACQTIDYNSRKQDRRERQKAVQQQRVQQKIAKLKRQGHKCCPDCKQPF